MGELGFSGSGTLGTTYTHTIEYEDVQIGDRILVSAQAPSLPAALSPIGEASTPADSQGNTYFGLGDNLWEADPPNVNEGARQHFFLSANITTPLIAGVDTITVHWTNPVYDRSISAWVIRHDGGNPAVVWIAFNDDNDAAVFASAQVTLQSPTFTPDRDNGLALATVFSAKAGGIGGFGSVAGYVNYFQALSRAFAGSKQVYRINLQTYGANALVINPFGLPNYEIDLGQLAGGVTVPAFNGVGQLYTAGANAWKGISIFSVD